MLNLLFYSFLYFVSFFASTTGNMIAPKSTHELTKNISTAATNSQVSPESHQIDYTKIIADSDILEDDDDDEKQISPSLKVHFHLPFTLFLRQLICFFNFLPNNSVQLAAQQAIADSTYNNLLPTGAIGAGLQIFRI